MAKKTQKRRGKPTNGKAKSRKPVAEKPSIEVMSDQERRRKLLNYCNVLTQPIDLLKQAKADVDEIYAKAKTEGIPKKEIDLWLKLKTEEGVESVKSEVERIQRIARWRGMAHQLDLFGAKEPGREEGLFEQGRRAGMDGYPRIPPSYLPQGDAQIWMEGHGSGCSTANTARADAVKAAGDFKPLADAAAKVLPPPLASGEPSSHVEH